MSKAGYFAKRTAELRMPKKANSLIIRFKGSDLTREELVLERLRDGAIRTSNTTTESHKNVEDHDPVLPAHLPHSE